MNRYQRQRVLPEIGAAGQKRLGRSRVLCIGAGGLGCAVLPYLAGAGVGHITLIDDDVVEAGNLHRQILFRDADQGRPKAEVAAEYLRALNPDIQIQAMVGRLNAGNAQRLFEEHDAVVEGSDNFDTKFLAGDAAVKFGVPLVYGSAVGLEAQVTVFDSDRGPCLRCLYPGPPDGWVPNCAENGVLGPLVGAAGCIQAIETLKLLLDDDNIHSRHHLIGRLWMLDAHELQSRTLRFERKTDCPCCSRRPIDIALHRPETDGEDSISPTDALALDKPVFLDIRDRDDWLRGHINGARHFPLQALMAGEVPELDRDGVCIVYCERGNRGRIAARLLRDATGLTIRNLSGGLSAWPRPLSEGEHGRDRCG